VSPSLRVRALLTLALVLSFGGCSTSASPAPTPSPGPRYDGLVVFGENIQAFGPCGRPEQWWIADQPAELTQQYRDVAGLGSRIVYVVIEGDITPAGHYGKDNTYDREIRISRLVSMDPARKNC
jgi:hypothetical protein